VGRVVVRTLRGIQPACEEATRLSHRVTQLQPGGRQWLKSQVTLEGSSPSGVGQMQVSSQLAHGSRVCNICMGVHGHVRDRVPCLHGSMPDSKLKSAFSVSF